MNSDNAIALAISKLVDLSHAGPNDPGDCTTGTGGDFAVFGGPATAPPTLNLGAVGRYDREWWQRGGGSLAARYIVVEVAVPAADAAGPLVLLACVRSVVEGGETAVEAALEVAESAAVLSFLSFDESKQ